MSSTAGMIESRKKDSAQKVESTLLVLEKYRKKKIPFTMRGIAKEAGVSVKFLYDNPVIREKIKELQGMSVNTSEENTEIIIKSLKKQLEEKQKEIDKLLADKSPNFRELYEQERERRIELEHQLMERFDPFTGLPKAG